MTVLPTDPNQVPVDKFTAAHFAVGALTCFLSIPFGYVAMGAVAFELIEDRLKRNNPGIFPVPTADSKNNALVDVGAVLVGWVTGEQIEILAGRKPRRPIR